MGVRLGGDGFLCVLVVLCGVVLKGRSVWFEFSAMLL